MTSFVLSVTLALSSMRCHARDDVTSSVVVMRCHARDDVTSSVVVTSYVAGMMT